MLGINFTAVFCVIGGGFIAIGAAAIHALLSNRGRAAAAEINAAAHREQANTITRALTASMPAPATEYADYGYDDPEYDDETKVRDTGIKEAIAALQLQLDDLRAQITGDHDHRDHGSWVEGVDFPHAANSATMHYTSSGTTIQGTAPATAAALSRIAYEPATTVVPQLGRDGRPMISNSGGGLFVVNPSAAARQRIAARTASNELRDLAGAIATACDDDSRLDLLWQYMHLLLPSPNDFLWGYCTLQDTNIGTWYEVLRPFTEEATGIAMAHALAKQFPDYQQSVEYQRYASLRQSAAPETI